MIGATQHQTRADGTPSPAHPIIKPGKNCWRLERAHRFACVQDGADYFRLVRHALLAARHTVFILGWDILAEVDLLPAAPAASARLAGAREPTRLRELLAFVARQRPDLRCYILIWDYAALYTLERDPWSRWKLGWRMPRHVRFGFDDRHPVGGSHHQKIVVVDDQLAFCGGIDLTGHRWDTSAHRVDEPARTSVGGPYGPYHEVQAMVTGPIATSLGVLARDRWRALGEGRLPPIGPSSRDLWPSDVTADLRDVDVAIARTLPGSETQPAIRECEALFLDSIASAKQSIYIESQYFTNDTLAAAMAARLREPSGPEILVVSPTECEGWLERNTMGAFRHDVFRQLLAADTHSRLRLVYPAASRAQQVPTFVHSKVMIVDDEFVRIGSANLSRRSMGVDTECDLALEAGGDSRVRAGIRDIRDRLLAEHLDLSSDAVASEIARAGSLCALVDARANADHTLVRLELQRDEETAPPAALRDAADPGEPIQFGSSVHQLVPPADATNGLRPLPLPIVPAIVLTTIVASISSALIWGQEFEVIRHALDAFPRTSSTLWIGAGVVLLANLALIPLDIIAIAAGVFFGALRGGIVALLGSLVGAGIVYVAGRTIGTAGLLRWMRLRSYRSARQLGAHGVAGVVMLRLASVASVASIHLICGAGRVPFGTFIAGTLLVLLPTVAALSALGAVLRYALLHPSVSSVLSVVGVTTLLVLVGVALRTFVLMRQFARSVSRHRVRAEFG